MSSTAPHQQRLLLLIPTLGFGGAEQQLALLAATLDRDRWDVHVHCLHGRGPFADELARAGIPVTCGRAPWAWPWLGYLAFKRRWLGGAREGGVIVGEVADASRRGWARRVNDVVGEGLYALTAIATWWTVRRLRPDVVHAFQSYSKLSVLSARLAGCRSTVYTEVALISDSLTPIQDRLYRFAIRRTSRVIAMSRAIEGQLVDRGIPPAQISIVPTMIACAVELPAPARGGGPLRLGVIGRLVEGKGHRFLIEALAALAGSHPQVRAVIAGDGPLRSVIEADVARRGLGHRVRVLGEFQELGAVMGEFDVFVLPSVSEGMPVSILEAMAFGKAVIASRVGGIPEEVDDERTGLLVPPADVAALAAAIARLADDPERVVQMGLAGQRRVREQFDAFPVTRSLERLYRELVDRL